MKQLLQNMRDGKTTVVEVPVPSVRRKFALIETSFSLVSAGTERMLVEFAEKSLVGKATSRPDLVKQVLSKAKREGVLPTIEAAFNKLDQPMALGYCSAGRIIEAGEGLEGFQPGERVACGGGGFAVHAEYGIVPQNLLIKLPDNVDDESAAFTTLGAVAMQGFRLAQPQLGENVCIIGLGLLGLMSVGIAKAAGCAVFGIDLSPARVELARKLGATAVPREGCEESASAFTQGRGFDSVLICADTSSNDPIELAGLLARDHGTVIAVGAFGLNIPRKIYYEKELTFKVSRSYGPGRYDPRYEEGGVDYPYGYVRWTEGRNMQSFVDLLASGKLDVHPLISHRFEIDQADQAYELITGKTGQPFLGVLLTYPKKSSALPLKRRVDYPEPTNDAAPVKVGVLGSGNYANAVFLPAVKKSGNAQLVGICSASGLSAQNAARKFGYGFASSTETDVLENAEINTVIVLTRHNQHTRQILAALKNGKNVYCEKPLALNEEELAAIEEQLQQPGCPLLTVGFNRRFSPFAVEMKKFFNPRSDSLHIHYRVNAGFLPTNHWLHDPQIGGGRIIGEGCHFIDFITYLVGEAPVAVKAFALPDGGLYHQDNVSLVYTFSDGSLGVIDYLANGNKNFSKERIEAFSAGKIAVLDDFRTLDLVSENDHKQKKSVLRQDKGHQAAWQAFANAITQGQAPTIPYEQLIGVTRASFAAIRSLDQGSEIKI